MANDIIKKQRSVLTVRIPKELHEKARDVAYATKSTLNDLVEDSLTDLLDHFEDIPKRKNSLKSGMKIK